MSVMIGRLSFVSKHGYQTSLLRTLIVLISITQKMTKVTTQLKDTHKKWTKEINNNSFGCYFQTILPRRGYRKRMKEIWFGFFV